MLRRKSPKRVTFSSIDRLVFAGLYRLALDVLEALKILKPENGDPLAPRRRPSLLALKITGTEWPTEDTPGIRQLTEAFGWEQAPQYIVRDRDASYGDVVIRRLRTMGIRDRPIAARSPWQNGHTERLIGSIRRDCLDHVVVFRERHLCHLLGLYQRYYNNARTHLSLNKDAPASRAVHAVGRIVPNPHLGGLHHQYVRI